MIRMLALAVVVLAAEGDDVNKVVRPGPRATDPRYMNAEQRRILAIQDALYGGFENINAPFAFTADPAFGPTHAVGEDGRLFIARLRNVLQDTIVASYTVACGGGAGTFEVGVAIYEVSQDAQGMATLNLVPGSAKFQNFTGPPGTDPSAMGVVVTPDAPFLLHRRRNYALGVEITTLTVGPFTHTMVNAPFSIATAASVLVSATTGMPNVLHISDTSPDTVVRASEIPIVIVRPAGQSRIWY